MSDKILSLRPNRPSLIRHLESYRVRAAGNGKALGLLVIQVKRGQEFGVLFGFRSIEALMQELAERLAGACRSDDRVMRTGEYEYAVILPELMNEGHALLAANKLLRSLTTPFEIDSQIITVGASMGIALFPDHAKDCDALLRYAELAAADAVRSDVPYKLYVPTAPEELAGSWDLESELDTALDNGELEIFYQAKINLRGGLLAGAEALLRWRSPKRGLVPPNVFIPVATRSGQIGELTWSALNMALQHAAAWPMRFGPLSLSVNIAPTLLEDSTLVSRVADAMGVWGAKPNRLILEITETAVMRNPDLSFETIRGLKSKGVLVSIDDFGTGYSSLANFKNIPASELKIDKSFVMNMLENPADASIVRTIISLAQAFDLQVAAEGVENLETLRSLTNMQCNYAQGYYISQPLPAAAFAQFINEYVPPVF
ncbi:MAG: bifunctional diguanylate cyclase/phosphodiesterase [Gammaproteobacteria bacterium]|nr:bifunctional diguanylate cyclase/phosphodiesterase [Gammaproteobacteria bacterium]MBU6508874.1 bifunctional diguanylate cyclase/phosphodiesterase [Gammaproteobacteria bacterium]MDE1983736.1 bifunctional diguanylate cyclase/phosphodiesterase [Gammaproteobacteria bacterium]MDE2108434.1 bifunctional diguanylate cyclase/phosphodiesterase [Gammaproteobacteria bacterium]